jgi:hypothetical protein
MKKFLTTLFEHVKLTLFKATIGASRILSAAFFTPNYAPASVYREVCGKLPMVLVNNAGALLCSKRAFCNNTIGGSI